MADLSDIQAAGATKLVGSDATGLEGVPVQSTAAGALHVNFRDSAGVEAGTAANPLNSQPVFKFSSAAVAANGNLIAIGSLQTYAGAIISISGTWVGQINFTAAADGGSVYLPIEAVPLNNTSASPSTTAFSNGLYYVPLGCTNLIVSVSNYVSGTVICTAQYTNVPLQIPSSSRSNSGGTQGALSVGTTALLVCSSGSANLFNRQMLSLFNNSSVTLYWGYTSAVTTATGTPIFRNQERGWMVGPNTNIYVIAGTAANDARITERA